MRCTFVINGTPRSAYKFPGVVISRASVDTPRSHLDASVTLGFDNVIDIDVRPGSTVDLAELAPLGTIPVSGMLALRASGRGVFDHPKLAGEIKITDFVFAGLPVGEVESPRFAFEPLVLDLFDARLRHGQSRARSAQVRLAFDKGATVVADADVDTREAPGLRVRDLFEIFHFEKDPRWADIDAVASGKARIHYVLGGREDQCGGGVLVVQTSMDLADVSLSGEHFDKGTVDAELLWDDQLAGAAGMTLDLRSLTLRKGEGSIVAGASLRKGGLLRANVLGSAIPLSHLDAFGALSQLPRRHGLGGGRGRRHRLAPSSSAPTSTSRGCASARRRSAPRASTSGWSPRPRLRRPAGCGCHNPRRAAPSKPGRATTSTSRTAT